MVALSLFPFCFFLDANGVAPVAFVDEPNPNPEAELGLLGGGVSLDEDEIVVDSGAFWDFEEFELEEEPSDLTAIFLGLA